MSDLPLERQSIRQLAKQIQAGDLSPVTLTEHYLNRIRTLDPTLHAFKLVCPERAMAEARAAELLVTIAAGPEGPIGPTGPCGPLGPMGPCAPLGPGGPDAPCGPLGPAGPAGP